ncbi:MAG: O-antigen ligase family protein [Thermoleophilaceae bacterium]
MEHPDLAQLAGAAGAVGAALVLVGRARAGLLLGLVVLALAEVGLALSLGGGVLDRLTTAGGAAAGSVGLLAVVAGAGLMVRWPAAVPVAVLAAAPFRPPLDFSPSNRFLVSVAQDGQLGRLLPLYFVLLTAAAALAWRLLRGERPRPLPPLIAYPSAAFFAFASLSLVWANDLEAGANLLLFFTLPFCVLLAVVSRAAFPDGVARALMITGVALASLFAAVGLVQAAIHKIFFFAPNLEVSNANTDYFRVTSLFGDPSLYGRHVVLGLCVVLAVLASSRMDPRAGIALLVLMWAGLLFSYSQSSMAALLVVTFALAVVSGEPGVRRLVAVAAAIAVVAGLGFVAAKVVSGESLNRATSDRLNRVEETARVVRRDPLVGVGLGGQPRASRRLAHSDRPSANFVSHTTPLTVAAELGIAGLLLYGWLLVGGARLLVEVTRAERALGLALGAVFLALFVHALSYSGFLEDPITWVVLAVGAGWLTWPRDEEHSRRRALRDGTRARTEPAAVAP